MQARMYDAASKYGLFDASVTPEALATNQAILGAVQSYITNPTQIRVGEAFTLTQFYSGGFKAIFKGTFSGSNYGTMTSLETYRIDTGEVIGTNYGRWSFTSGVATPPEAGFGGSDEIYGNNYNNKLKGFGGDDFIDGQGGIDTALYGGVHKTYSITKNNALWNVAGNGEGTDTLTNIERLQFSDKKVALDVTDNALETLQFIGVVAPSLQSNLNVRGTILSLFDQGKSMQEMSQLALDLGLITSDNTALAKTVFKNVFNTTADPDQGLTNTLVNFIQQNGDAKFLATVAGLNINVDLVGLQQHGMEFI